MARFFLTLLILLRKIYSSLPLNNTQLPIAQLAKTLIKNQSWSHVN